MELLHRDLIAVHEKVQQVNSQVSRCGAQPEVVADNGDEVGKVPSQVELRRLAFVGGQLWLLAEKTMRLRQPCYSSSGAVASPYARQAIF